YRSPQILRGGVGFADHLAAFARRRLQSVEIAHGIPLAHRLDRGRSQSRPVAGLSATRPVAGRDQAKPPAAALVGRPRGPGVVPTPRPAPRATPRTIGARTLPPAPGGGPRPPLRAPSAGLPVSTAPARAGRGSGSGVRQPAVCGADGRPARFG